MNRSQFRKAVEDSDEPTPGYLYNTLSQWTYADRRTQNQLVDALFDKLQPPSVSAPTSVRVLYKVLHLIHVLCESGHPDFQKEVQTSAHSSALKLYTNYHGRPDPMHGDALNDKVRREAKAALEAAFNTRPEEKSDFYGGSGATHRGSCSTGGRTIEGYANPTYAKEDGCDGFHTGEQYSASPGGHSNDDSVMGPQRSCQRGTHVGEMPKENRWMEYVAEAEAKRTTQPANTLLLQLAGKAKAGWELIKEHEGLKRMEDRIYDRTSKRAVMLEADETERRRGGNSRGAAMIGKLYEQDELTTGAYQPVGVPTLPDKEGEKYETGGGHCAVADATAGLSVAAALMDAVSGDGRELEQRATSVTDGPAHSSTVASAVPQSPFRCIIHRLTSMRGTPQRVELAAFAADCLAEGERLISAGGAKKTAAALGGTSAQAASVSCFLLSSSPSPPPASTAAASAEPPAPASAFAFLRATPDATDPPPSFSPQQPSQSPSLSPADVWPALANALDEQLQPSLPWQQRLNALCGLETLLQRGGSNGNTGNGGGSMATAVKKYFQLSPSHIRRNTHVAQSSLREKAVRVAGMLAIATEAPAVDLTGLAVRSGRSEATAGSSSRSQQRQQPIVGAFDFDDGLGMSPSPREGANQASPAAYVGGASAAPPSTRVPPLSTASGGPLTLRRRGAASSNANRASGGSDGTPAAAAQASALDDLFGTPSSSSPQSSAAPVSATAASTSGGNEDDFLAPRAPAQRALSRIFGVGIHPMSGAAEDANSGPLWTAVPPAAQQQQWEYGSYLEGNDAPAVEGSAYVSTGRVHTGKPPAGSIESMNRALAEMQRKLMEEPS